MAVLNPVFGLVIALGASAGAQGHAIDEYQVKAAFLYNFAKFVEWPPRSFKSASQSIAICILGENAFSPSLEQAVAGKVIEGRGFVVRQISNTQQAARCQILFVSASERTRSRSILDDLKSSGVLTVGETDGFAGQGGVINFKLADDRVRIEINLQAAEREQIRISSKLLSLAQIVKKQAPTK